MQPDNQNSRNDIPLLNLDVQWAFPHVSLYVLSINLSSLMITWISAFSKHVIFVYVQSYMIDNMRHSDLKGIFLILKMHVWKYVLY